MGKEKTTEEIKRLLKPAPKATNQSSEEIVQASRNLDNYRKSIDNEGREQFFKLRKNWSCFIIYCIAALIIAQIAVIFFVGLGWLNLIEYKSIALAFFIETFFQVVGLAILVVAFLFNEKTN